ncbi:MAG: cation:proton antiporter [Candidatus Altiarchaeota archaeon]|nr:cation:proton antiporter [Candidatus Altiarchaeota archaeon]
MVEVDIIFFALGLVILLGFFSLRFFERTKIPDVLILMFTGILIAQNLSHAEIETVKSFAPYVGALALMMILFEGGLNLKFHRVVQELPLTTVFTLAVFALGCIVVVFVMTVFFGWEPISALLLATILGGTSSAIVVPLLSKLHVGDSTRVFLMLESTLTDALCVISALTVMGVMESGGFADFRAISNDLFSAFTIAAFVAFLFGILWIRILGRFHGMPFGYLLTVSVIFILYGLVEYSHANGAIAAFVFGLVIGNSKEITRFLRIAGDVLAEERIRSFHEEVSFFIRTFFFLYLGLIFNPGMVNASVFFLSVMVLLALIFARFLPTFFMLRRSREMQDYGTMIATMMPRGLAAAVLASEIGARQLPITEVKPQEFTYVVILVIIFTNVMATAGTFLYEVIRARKMEDGFPADRDYDKLLGSKEPAREEKKDESEASEFASGGKIEEAKEEPPKPAAEKKAATPVPEKPADKEPVKEDEAVVENDEEPVVKPAIYKKEESSRD